LTLFNRKKTILIYATSGDREHFNNSNIENVKMKN
jgi:hypothetical protein